MRGLLYTTARLSTFTRHLVATETHPGGPGSICRTKKPMAPRRLYLGTRTYLQRTIANEIWPRSFTTVSHSSKRPRRSATTVKAWSRSITSEHKKGCVHTAFFIQHLAKIVKSWYTVLAVDSFQREGGAPLEILVTFIVSVVASIVAYYVCKWLDRND